MTSTPKPSDEFDAVRIVFETLKSFPKDEQQRLLRWVQEKLGLATIAVAAPSPPATTVNSNNAAVSPHNPIHTSHGGIDIRSFINDKAPKSDNQLAATVAYYYKFEAPETERKDSINKDDLIDACRKSQRKRPGSAAQVLVNALHQGLLDKEERGQYRINSVGENLVAMVLPNQDGASSKRPTNKKAVKKKAAASKTKRSGK